MPRSKPLTERQAREALKLAIDDVMRTSLVLGWAIAHGTATEKAAQDIDAAKARALRAYRAAILRGRQKTSKVNSVPRS